MVLWAFLLGLGLWLAGLAYVVWRALGLWRDAKGAGRTISSEMALFEERAARTERLLADAERANADLEAALARLRDSRARLQVLLDALERARRRTRWLRAFLPLR